ncbi:hypothetical protein [Croceicoccus bisphenolivorans]|uniref:hypothetical protein n=1 Tax=Croceicoccus bisphenolivorans TaxID=1783232 RepID=UPI000AA30DB0|nr:hypothetical protein [Croceicoccus bisphenolivorans]
MNKLNRAQLSETIDGVQECLAAVDAMGLTRAGAILETALMELRSIEQSVEALNAAARSNSVGNSGNLSA